MTSTPESPKPAEPESTASQDVEPQDVEPQDVERQDVEPQDVAPQDGAPESVEAGPAEAEEPDSAPTPVAADHDDPLPAELDEDDDEDQDDEGEILGEEFAVPAGPDLVQAVGAVLALLVAVSVLLVAFGLPALKGSPHDVPIGVAGTPEITAQVKTLFAQGGSTSFSVKAYTDEAKMRKAITDRKIYGGLSVSTSAATMLVATGASPVVAQSLNSVASNLGSSGGISIPIDDVVPVPAADARGSGFAAIGLPMVVAGILASSLMLFRRFRESLSTVLGVAFGFSLLAGFALGGILQFGFKAVEGNFLVTALSISLGVAAIAFPLTGLGSIAGRIGVGIGAAVMLLLGYPLSGISTAPEWLPGFWGTLGQALPPGAAGTLLRSAAFFDGRGAGTALIVLAAWTLGGLLLVVIGALLNPADPFDEADEVVPEPETELVPA